MSEEPEPRIKALLEIQQFDRIHNDLINAAFHLKERICKADESGEREGMGLDLMAAVTMTAFAYEAYLNFIGHAALKDWKEFSPQWQKEVAITEALGIERNLERRPFSTVNKLREVRNTLAHGKPTFEEHAWEAEGTHSELTATLKAFQAGLEVTITRAFLEEAYADVEEIWKLMLQRADIQVWETMGHGAGGITFLSFAEKEKG